MNLNCLNNIISENLAINIDLSNVKSWNLNSGFTSTSLTKWSNAISDNINLIDFGLTNFDVGRTNVMWSGITLSPKDTLFTMYRIGYNNVVNPSTGNTSGITATTEYSPYDINAITTGFSGNYFILDGGYLQGFFKLNDYNYELLPSRYNKGITIETIIYLYPESYGMFYMMGVRSEDKYNPYYDGELITGASENIGITTSFNNYLDSFTEEIITKKAFGNVEDNKITTYSTTPLIDNLKNNLIAFEITEDKKIAYKYINNNGSIITNSSNTTISNTGFTMISISFTPNEIINDPDLIECYSQRSGDLIFYVNGRANWIIKDFPEFYFKSILNNKEKQIGVPYSISWGGGSFGLKHSWHYDYQTYSLYTGQNIDSINANFFIEDNPIPTECNLIPNDNYLFGLSLSANSTTFSNIDECTGVETPITVMEIKHTGNTATTYFIKYNNLVSILSNRDYIINALIYNDEFLNINAINKISILVYSDNVDVNIIDNINYISGNGWKDLMCKFNITNNTGQQFVNIGLLIESSELINFNTSLFVNDFTYTGADILVQDERKNDLLIEQNFNSSFIGGIQKLRIYDNALTSEEILHNALFESTLNPNIIVSKGGRIIYR
jgi:hypothetical protein